MASFRGFLGHRIARVYPLYAATTLIAAAAIAAGWLEYRGHMLALDLPLNLLMVQSWFSLQSLDGPGWSISAEWAAYLVFPLLVPLVLSKRNAPAILATAVAAILTVAIFLIAPGDGLLIHGAPLVRCLGEFTLGLFVFRLYEAPQLTKLRTMGWLELAVAGLYLLSLALPHFEIGTVFLSAALILMLSSDAGPVSRLLSSAVPYRLGVLSFSIYLVHDLFSGLMGWLHRMANAHGLHHGQMVATIITVPLVLVSSDLASRWIEVPGRKALRRIFDRNASRAVVVA